MKYSLVCLFLASLTASTVSLAQDPQPQSVGVAPPYKAVFTKAHGIRGIDAPTGELSDSIQQLAKRAAVGDGHAAAQIYAGLSACQALKNRQSLSYGSHCSGITNDDLASTGKWLDLAASLGDGEAQYAYAVGGFDAVVGVQNAQKHPEQFKAYQARAKQYLLDLADECNFDAISMIASSGGSDGIVFGSDASTAYKFQLVREQLITGPQNIDRTYRSHLESKLTGMQVDDAQREATKFILHHCM
ncbi:hypothetical protein SAMN04487785_10910 [Dyella jiangningensis]|uniref:hypothetical protein n=1 Tax=Dyella sp. AtDHG13 TaxID=1938897 RepID=UPI00088F9B45|nr:hypothetical protein [Dyella sp. AtDHG13]PXV56887.1 hypothetical protein BDW41_1089 [Dyella sp. AtDHG13]SDK59780.1 hypothetical protein SAMN04487785_10910 [Dyella jiangningensis]